ncbi:MAG: AraC family transcriptional regulator [Paludibacteraceae bacterium]|nr:AraC family transcriptional regulator [Paludibacteraceae bacterium]MBR4704296.1 AraC family transcriptional regulator [Paludibacteraceae bacterium]MBR4705239.1 AraC family transcriptional regulator [Paludibacteraceae bacterium]
MTDKSYKKLRHFYYEYRSEAAFGIVLMAAVAVSYILSPLIPVDIFSSIIAPVQNTAIITVTLINTWAMFRHNEGLRIRRIYAWIMAALTVLMIVGLCYRFRVNSELRPAEGIFSFEGWELMAGDLIAWLLLAYPAELLRPGWLTVKNAMTRVLPVLVIGAIDWCVPWDLRWLLALVPLVWIALLIHHLRAYRRFSEENFGSVEQTDEQWVIRYLVMIFVLGCSYAYLCFTEEPNRLFTQQWLIFFIFVYTNDQVIFRSKPWMEDAVQETGNVEVEELSSAEMSASNIASNAEYRRALEEWMASEKPYLNPNFRLTDLRKVLPMNRTYLSQFINAEYDCTFYQFVTNYRIEEAKLQMRQNPNLKMQQISELCGFSSATVFGRIFARETGLTPTEWIAQFDNK